MANSLLSIDLSSANNAPPLFSVIDEAFGGCDDGLDLRVQAELKSIFHKHCHKIGKPMGERIRELMALDALGQDHVRILIERHMARIGMSPLTVAPQAAQQPVPTSHPTQAN